MEILEYFDRSVIEKLWKEDKYTKTQWGNLICRQVSDFSTVDLVIFNVEEERGTKNNQGTAGGGESIRRYLYALQQADYSINMVDLGTIKAGNSITDTYFAVKEVVGQLLREQVLPIIIGGSRDLIYANYLGYTTEEQMVNLVSIDSAFALGNADDPINEKNYFSKIILHQPNILFNYSNLAYQTYFINQEEHKLLDELFYDIYRLGWVKEDIKKAEPIIRNADFIGFSMNAVAQPYAPANKNTSPNGLNGEQACQLCKYAGISDKLTSFGIYDYNPAIEDQGMTAHLIAQMIWYFVDGFYNRKMDFPKANKKDYTRYTVDIDEGKQELIFYKSPKSDRWWMEIPYNSSFNKNLQRHLMLPCNYGDYQTAMENEMPERWFQTYKKLK
jgi:arginase family enzyme